MRKKTKMIIDPKYILIAISVICAILIVVSFKFQDKIEPVRSIVGGVVTPMQKESILSELKYPTNLNM